MHGRHHAQSRRLQDNEHQESTDDRWGVLRNGEQFLVAMRGPMQEETLQRVKETLLVHRGWLSSYIPENTVLGIGPSTAAEAVRHVPGVLWVVSSQTGLPLKVCFYGSFQN